MNYPVQGGLFFAGTFCKPCPPVEHTFEQHDKINLMATIQMSAADFKEKVFNYEASEEWQYLGQRPAIIDFYADWCGPCKAVAPVLEELSEQYQGQVDIYKIDTDKEQELSALFGIQSIPTFLFIPMQGSPMLQKGALPKNAFQQVIDQRLLQPEEKA